MHTLHVVNLWSCWDYFFHRPPRNSSFFVMLHWGLNSLATGALILISGGCVATPPKSQQVSHDPLLARKGGVLLLVDSCVQRDTIGSTSDYFVIKESEAGGKAALESLRKYVHDSAIPVHAEIVTVGAANLGTNNSLIRVADQVGDPVREARQPFRVPDELKDDAEFVKAISVICTYAVERAAVSKKTNEVEQSEITAADIPTQITRHEFQAAAQVLKNRTRVSTVLFLELAGTSRSGGKATAQFLGSMVVSMASAFATAGVGTGYYAMFTPGHQIDGILMEGALIDLESGELTWSKAVRTFGNPVNPKKMSDPQGLDLLFHDVMFKPALNQPPKP